MAERSRGGLVGRILQEVETRSGVTVVDSDRVALLEQAYVDLRAQTRELDLLGYTALAWNTGNTKEMRPESRRAVAQKVLVAWMYDPQLARSISMLNDFTFGRGVPQPRAKDKKVQEVLDEFWNDLDNKILLTSHDGQVAMGTDLSIQSNLFLLIFNNGRDGKIKVGLLAHDSVEDVVRDDDYRLRILYYVARETKQTYDYEQGRYITDTASMARPVLKYYEHYANVDSLEDGAKRAPAEKVGEGRVYHIAVNRTTEMAFGVPEMQRVLRWASAYNDFMAARVDMMKAAAAFVMKRKIKGTPNQLTKMATRAISRTSPLAGIQDPIYPSAGRAAGIMNENDLVSHEAMKLDTGASQAAADAAMVHGQIAAGVGLPKHYLGGGDANLALATAMEIFVIKLVESRQEVFEGLYRALFDMVIQKAIDDGRIDETADPADVEPLPEQVDYAAYQEAAADVLVSAGLVEADQRDEVIDLLAARVVEGNPTAAQKCKFCKSPATGSFVWANGNAYVPWCAGHKERARSIIVDKNNDEIDREHQIVEGIENEAAQERDTKRDLTYEFSMPSPLRRMMSDMVTSIQGIAQTFDPNNTNTELSRVLLAIALGEALEVDDPASLVEKILPEGYVDPLIAMAQQQQGQGGNMFGPGAKGPVPGVPASGDVGADGKGYGAPMKATPPEKVPGTQEGRVIAVRGRDGEVIWNLVEQRDARPDENEALVTQVRGRSVGLDALFDSEVGQVALGELNALMVGASTTNGNHEEGE